MGCGGTTVGSSDGPPAQNGTGGGHGIGVGGSTSTGGTRSEAGGSNTGGWSTGGAGTGGASTGGASTGIPTCNTASSKQCFTPEGLKSFAAARGLTVPVSPAVDAGAVDAGADADASPQPTSSACPAITGTWTCGWITDGPTAENGQCCYSVASSNCCGRPFVVGGMGRTAPCEARGDWLASPRVDPGALSPRLREALAEAWLGDARLEHASIAAFARFTLQLLAFGAPAELVSAAQAAMADEIRHARACFTLASRYLGADVGPGPLDIAGAVAGEGLLEAVILAIEEGCVGETMAALLAAEQAEHAADPEIRRVLVGVAEDEARHAELSWKFVAWAIEALPGAARATLWTAFERGLSRQAASADVPGVDLAEWRAHGRLGAKDQARVLDHATREVILPCMERLLGARRCATTLRRRSSNAFYSQRASHRRRQRSRSVE